MDPYLSILKQRTKDPLIETIIELEQQLKDMVKSATDFSTDIDALLAEAYKSAVAGPSQKWLDIQKERKEKSWEWKTLTKTVPHLLTTNVPAEWPLLASLGNQYTCDIPLSLAALHLYWFQNFYDLNYATDVICLPYFSCTFLGFNQNDVYIENPHNFNELLFLKMEQYIEKESVFTTYRNTSGIQSETSEYETDTSISQNDSDSDEESPSYAPPSSHITPLGSFTATSANLAITDLIILGFR